jgi:hypothetical protein
MKIIFSSKNFTDLNTNAHAEMTHLKAMHDKIT